MKRLGPELKMPELKAPTFLADLWWDLVDRRLLPLLALIVVAIVAVPFLMGKSKEVPQTSLAALAATRETPLATSGGRDLTVVQAEPGLRDFHKRLSHLRPTDPFMQRFTAPVVTAHLKSETTSSTSSTTSTSGGGGEGGAAQTTSPGSAPSSAPASGAPSSGQPVVHRTIYAFTADLKIKRSGGREAEAGEKPEEWVKNKVMPFTPLPFKKLPVVVYMGPSRKGNAVFLVSSHVVSMSGKDTCLSGEEEGTCQLIEVDPNSPETFVYGANEVRYTIKLLRIEQVAIQSFSK